MIEKISWEKTWGREYEIVEKKAFLEPFFQKLEREGKIGNIVVDVGSGFYNVSKFIPGEHKRVSIDIAGEEGGDRRSFQHIKYDVEKIENDEMFSTKKAIAKIAKFLNIDPRNETNIEAADTIIFSEILNYVDYEKILSGFLRYLKPDGRYIIINMPGKGFQELFSEKGIKNNEELLQFLKTENLELEEVKTPMPNIPQLIIVVAKKRKS